MKEERFVLKRGKKSFSLSVNRLTFFSMFIGLMFKRKEKAKVLLFDWGKNTKNGIHSFFVFYDFLAVWVAENKNVISVDYVKPFSFYVGCKKKYRYLIEIPVNKNNKKLIKSFGF